MTKTLRKISQKKFKIQNKKFCLKVIGRVQKSFLDKKIFFLNFEFFWWIFLSVLVIFYGKKILCLEMISGPSWSIWDIKFFFARKKCFDTFRWVSSFGNPFLWAQSSGFEPNVRNLVQKSNFGRTIPARLTTLQKNGKNQKTVLPDSFFWFDGFQSTKSLQTTVWPSFETFYHQKVQFWPIFRFLAITTETGPRVLNWAFWLVFGLKKTCGWVSYTE